MIAQPRSLLARTARRRSSTSNGTSRARWRRSRRSTFISETPEYWKALARTDRGRAARALPRARGPDRRGGRLFPGGGEYEPRNRWNTTDGIVHFIMTINSMEDLLGVSQERRKPPRPRLTASTPSPTAQDRRRRPSQRRPLVDVPQGLLGRPPPIRPASYMIDWDDTGLEKPDGTPVDDYWRWCGAPAARRCGSQYEVPDGEGFAVGDIRIGGRPITTGGQLAEHITVMAARGVAGVAAHEARSVAQALASADRAVLPAPCRGVAARRPPSRRRVAGGSREGRPIYDAASRRRHPGQRHPGVQQGPPALPVPALRRPSRAPGAGCAWLAPRLATMDDVLAFRARVPRGAAAPGRARAAADRDVGQRRVLPRRRSPRSPARTEADAFGDESFRQGLAARSTYLGDPTVPSTRATATAGWSAAPTRGRRARDRRRRRRRAICDRRSPSRSRGAHRRHLGRVRASAATPCPATCAGHEHFGFKDGISQPGVRGQRRRAPATSSPRATSPTTIPHARLFAKPGSRCSGPASSCSASRARTRRTRSHRRRPPTTFPRLGAPRLLPGVPPPAPGRRRLLDLRASTAAARSAWRPIRFASHARRPLAERRAADAGARRRRPRARRRRVRQQPLPVRRRHPPVGARADRRLRRRRAPAGGGRRLRPGLPARRPHPQGQPARQRHRLRHARRHAAAADAAPRHPVRRRPIAGVERPAARARRAPSAA